MTEHGDIAGWCCDPRLDDEREVMRDGGRGIVARELRARISIWRDRFSAARGHRYVVFEERADEFAAALFGAWQAGVVPWLPGDLLPATRAAVQSQVDGFADGLRMDSAVDTAAAMGLSHLDPDACRVVLFTSGSTGEPVAIEKTLRQLEAEIAALERQFGAGLDGAVVQGTVSHQHIYGLLFRVLWPLAMRRVCATARLEFPEQIAAVRGKTVLVASPAHLKRLPESIDWTAFSAALSAVFSSGGPLPLDAAQMVSRLWKRGAIEVFGSTETGGIAWRQGGGAASAWRALPGVEWRVSGGNLEVRSPHLAGPNWYATEDRAIAVADGFELRGRGDRIHKLEERRISLSAIERCLMQSADVETAQVLALPGPRTTLAAVVLLSPTGRQQMEMRGKQAMVLALREGLRGQVDPIALPRQWRFPASVPVDARGKTSTRALQALFRPWMPDPHWLCRTSTHAEAELEVSAELLGFDGHFPTTSVLPGVAMLDWARRLAAEVFGICAPCRRMEAIKFQQIVSPPARLHLRMDWNPDARALGFQFLAGDVRHASGKLHFDAQVEA